MNSLVDSARRYIAKENAAVSGQGGHNQTFHVASVLVNGFGLSIDDARPLLREYNTRCQPPWSEQQLEHKLKSAEQAQDPKGKGYLKRARTYVRQDSYTPSISRLESGPAKVDSGAGKPTSSDGGKRYTLDEAAILPEPIEDGTRALIKAAFEEGESIRVVPACLNEEEKEIPDGDGFTLTRELWLAKLNGKDGNPNEILRSSEDAGIYIAINPLKPGGTKDADVTAFRHCLIESDEKSLGAQWDLIRKSNLPCTAVIHSGGDSVHAWVRVDASTREEYNERVKIVLDHLADYGVDFKNKNPSRLSRLPNCERFDKRQELLALKIGAESFDAWHNSQGQGLPQIVSLAEGVRMLADGRLAAPRVLIDGVLHQGHKLVLGGGSKTNKTWALMNLALAVANGGKWLEHFQCLQGRVLYLNFEIDTYHAFWRLNRVTQELKLDPAENMDVWNLRGHNAPYSDMIPALIDSIKGKEYALVVLDPLYKLLGGADENKATDITQMLNSLESLAVHTKAAVAFGAHFSKGNQAGKESIDRISGSGVFARDPDSIMALTRHEEENCFAVDFTLRNFPAVKPFVVKWAFPLMRRNDALDPKRLKKEPKNEAKYFVEDVIRCLAGKRLSRLNWQEECKALIGMSSATFERLKSDALKAGKIQTEGEGKTKLFFIESNPY